MGGARAVWRLAACQLIWTFCTTAALAQDPPPANAPNEEPQPEAVESPPLPEDVDKYAPPKYTAAQKREWELKQRLKYTQSLKADRLSNADKEVLTSGVQYYLYRMTMPEEFNNLHEIVRKLVDEINSRVTSVEARAFMNEEVVRIGEELLDQHPHVRRNVLILAAQLCADPRAEPPTPFVGASKLFLTVLNDPSQFAAEKLWAAKGLARIGLSSELVISERSRIATDLVAAIDTPQAKEPLNWPYRMRLVDALGNCGLVYDVTRQPLVIDALMKIVVNQQENWIVRSAAARAVTQLPYAAEDKVNVPLVCYEITRLGHQMAQARNQNIAAGHWKLCFLNLYTAFIPQTAEQKQKKWGLLQQVTRTGYGQYEPLVKEAYEVVVPVVNSVVSTVDAPATPQQLIQDMGDWLQNNVPSDLKPTPASQDLNASPPTPDPMATNQAVPPAENTTPTAAAGPVRASRAPASTPD
jgi:hypothetical protein